MYVQQNYDGRTAHFAPSLTSGIARLPAPWSKSISAALQPLRKQNDFALNFAIYIPDKFNKRPNV